MKLVRDKPDNPPGAPVRPYVSQKQSRSAEPPIAAPGPAAAPVPAPGGELHDRVRSAVVARLGTQVDANLLDVIIRRVLTSTGVK
jgi:hypothetical protein